MGYYLVKLKNDKEHYLMADTWETVDDRLQFYWGELKIKHFTSKEVETVKTISEEEYIRGAKTIDKPNDEVNHPSHYQIGGIETVDVIKELLSEEEFIGYLKGTFIKYRERHPYKGKATQDLEKAKWFWDKLQEVKEDEY